MIDLPALREYCATLKGTEETYPFDETTLVIKVMGKMFALMPTDLPSDQAQTVSLKCDPTLAQLLRQTYPTVQPGYHLSKKHWNTVTLDGTISDDEIYEMIDNSYALVVKKIKKSEREALKNL